MSFRSDQPVPQSVIKQQCSRYSPSDRPLKVLSIAHSAFQDGSARLRYYPLALDPSISLTLVIPDRWQEGGRTLQKGSVTGPLNVQTRRILLPQLPKASWYAHFYTGLTQVIRRLSPDVIHLWEEPWSVVALQLCFLRARLAPNAALILETEQNIFRRLPPPFESIRGYSLRLTDMMIARQKEALDVTRRCGYRGPATLVEYTFDESVFHPQDAGRCRSELGFSGFTIGYVGRIDRSKGLFTVLTALKQCPEPIRFVLIGAGPDEEALKTESQRLGLTDRVKMIPYQKS